MFYPKTSRVAIYKADPFRSPYLWSSWIEGWYLAKGCYIILNCMIKRVWFGLESFAWLWKKESWIRNACLSKLFFILQWRRRRPRDTTCLGQSLTAAQITSFLTPSLVLFGSPGSTGEQILPCLLPSNFLVPTFSDSLARQRGID